MQVRTAAILCAGVLSLVPMRAGAGIGTLDDRTLAYTFSFFTDVDGYNVFTHYGGTGVTLEGGARVDLEWVHDVVVFPAVDAAPGTQEAVDAITTASRPLAANADPFEDFVKVRDSIEASVSARGTRIGYYVSTESDYFAQMVSASYNHDFFDDNFNLAGAVSYSWDSIEPLEDEDTSTLDDYRRTTYWSLVATRVLTRTTVARVGAELNLVSGLQHAPYRNVYVAGTNVPERHPDERRRRDVFVSLSQYITNLSSVKLDYRFYDDDWGVSSHTWGLKLNQYVTDEWIVRYRYRYYTQVAAYFFRDEYTQPGGVGGYQTEDYRLGDFGAHLFGGRVMWRPYRILGKYGFPQRAHLIFGYERYFNSNNFTATILETGIEVSF